MPKRSKSIPYYIVVVCLCLIFGSMIAVYVWQIFEDGVVSIVIQGSSVGFDTPIFLAVLFSLIGFVILAILNFRNKKVKTLIRISALLFGLLFIFSLGYLSFGWTSYAPIVPSRGSFSPNFLFAILLGLKIAVVVTMLLIIFRWFKTRRIADNIGIPKHPLV